MKVLKTKAEMSAVAESWRIENLDVGLVPTMGFLHEGHLSLIRIARQHADKVVVSIFVNPTQFAPGEDFAAYPRDEARDLAMCEAEGADVVFLPSPEEMYAPDASVALTENRLAKTMCGLTRPTHFQGVLTVVNKLFNITRADSAVFGMKDAQQLAVIRRMVRDLDMPIAIVPGPIVREPDGLAMSSRNTYLSADERRHALCLRRSLDLAEAMWRRGDSAADAVLGAMREQIAPTPGAVIDYIVAVDADSLEPVETLRPNTLVALAVKIGRTRLIDNTILNKKTP
ncbi:MAG: pantoate--beta-alanine ligase [Kiritimatiellae bacterium]|jgi:pantoate--beta-alanine ligase|nr:pantoate--beta-alanine ligase [Kiritimatiellia bacterium]NLE41043.1 pantoate--beta-alanine ligase [Lentisphaerota bacterium]